MDPTFGTTPPPVDPVGHAVRAGLAAAGPGSLVLAVSGGPDSMALLHAVVAQGLADRVATVATFDHRTGPAARRAAALVRRTASAWGLPVTAGAADAPLPDVGEAAWREARWRFLRAVARATGGRVVTAHTRDDQRETVAFRLWRGSGPHGLAALDVADGPLRPLLPVPRAETVAYAARHAVPCVDDPANTDRRHARVRWRLDLLPALERAQPGFGDWVDALGHRAAAWRRDVDRLVSATVHRTHGPAGWEFDLGALATVSPADLAWCWPAIVGPAGVTLDRRALARLAALPAAALAGPAGPIVPLAGGGALVALGGGRWLLRRSAADRAPVAPSAPVPLTGAVAFGAWRFRPAADDGPPGAWHPRLPADIHLVVRAWRPGDRLAGPAGPRRVKRWLADAGIPGPLRAGWPVVADDANVWWIPGVRQAELPPDAPSLRYVCDRRPD